MRSNEGPKCFPCAFRKCRCEKRKVKVEDDVERSVGVEKTKGNGRKDTCFANGLATPVLIVVAVQLCVNFCAIKWFAGSYFICGLPSFGGTYKDSHADLKVTASGNPTRLYRKSIPYNKFEGVYYENDALSLHGPGVEKLSKTYLGIDFAPKYVAHTRQDSSASENRKDNEASKAFRWQPKARLNGDDLNGENEFPPSGVNPNSFSATFNGRFFFEAGQHRFVLATSGGVRLFVDNTLVSDDISHVSNSIREPFVGSYLVNMPTSGDRDISLEFRHYPAVSSYSHWKEFGLSTRHSDHIDQHHDWKQIADIMLQAHLHLHWLKDDLGLKIFMYNLPPRFNDDIRISNKKCRDGHMFGSEVAVHLALTESSARTLDPREADLFYVPVYTACKYLGAPYFGVDPWFGKRMTKQAIKYIKQEFPFWRRHNGADHIFAMTYDYGACFEYKYSKANAAGVLRDVNNAILLSIISDASVSCFRPSIDVPIPTFIGHSNKLLTPLPKPALLGKRTVASSIQTGRIRDSDTEQRDWFAYFQGQKEWAIDHDPEYSNGIRKLIFAQYSGDPLFHLGEGKTPQYVENLRRSVFCLCPRGFAVWSPRPYESIASGCIPVIIADNMHLPFSFKGSGIDWREFSVMIPESRVREGGDSGTQLKRILLSITPEAILAKQRALRRVRNQMIFLPPASNFDSKIGVKHHENGVPLRGDAFEMVILALREKVRAADWIGSRIGSRFWS